MKDQASELEQLHQAIEDLNARMDQVRGAQPTAPDFSSKLERLNFYRREDAQEWNLLTNRVNSYITSQSFLVSAFAVSMANPDLRFRLCFPVILSVIGIIASLRAYPGIDGASRIIQLWHDKKTELLTDPCLSDFCDGRAEVVPQTPYRRLVVRLTSNSRIGRRGRYGEAARGTREADPTPEAGERVDEIHITSLYFAHVAPKLFGAAWVVLLVLAVVLHYVH